MSVSGIGGGLSAALAAYSAAGSGGSPEAVAGGGGGAGVELLKQAIDVEAELAMKLIQATVQTNFDNQKMALAQQIIDVYA